MTQSPDPDTEAAHAFEAMRRELTLLRHAVEGLTAAREGVPDYSETLARIGQAMSASHARLKQIEESPLLSLTPAATAQQMNKAAQDVRADDRRALHEARDALSHALGHVDGMVNRGRASDRQRNITLWTAFGAFLLGVLLWSFLPGALARALPESWHVREWMAARTMGMDQETAGRRMIAVARQVHRSTQTAEDHKHSKAAR